MKIKISFSITFPESKLIKSILLRKLRTVHSVNKYDAITNILTAAVGFTTYRDAISQIRKNRAR